MKEYTTRVRDAVRAYTEFGLVVVPVEHKGKRPLANTWQQSKVSDHVGAFDSDEAMNVGVLLGSRSGGTVDIDLDTPRARSLADEYLPPTPAVFGRASAPRSHRIYRVTGEPGRGKRYADDTGATAVEWRADGGQTVFPPSVHTSGESIQWASGGDRMPEPARVAEADLRRAVESLAKACGWVESRPESVPVRIDPAASGADTPLDERKRRAIAYLDAMPNSVEGQRGSDDLMRVARAVCWGFDLGEVGGFDMIQAYYNFPPRCQPAWSERELRHKCHDAMKAEGFRYPSGWLLAEREDYMPSVRELAEPEPEPAFNVADPGAFPAELLKVPGLIGEVMKLNLANAFRPQPTLALAGALALQAVIAGRRVKDRAGNRTNVMLLGVGASASGKEYARSLNSRILRAAEMGDHAIDELASEAALANALAAQPSLLVQIDEMGRFLATTSDARGASHLYGVPTLLLKLWSAAGGAYEKVYADRKRNIMIVEPCCVLYGTTVPDNLYPAFNSESVRGGLLGRMMILEAPLGLPDDQDGTSDPDIPESILNAVRGWREFAGGNLASVNCAGLPAEPHCVPETDGASEVFRAARATERAWTESSSDANAALWGRMVERARRLALIYACSASGPDKAAIAIDESAARWACRLSEHLTQRMVYLADRNIADTSHERNIKAISGYVESRGSVRMSELTTRFRSISRREREAAIEDLEDSGAVLRFKLESEGRGRPAQVVRWARERAA